MRRDLGDQGAGWRGGEERVLAGYSSDGRMVGIEGRLEELHGSSGAEGVAGKDDSARALDVEGVAKLLQGGAWCAVIEVPEGVAVPAIKRCEGFKDEPELPKADAKLPVPGSPILRSLGVGDADVGYCTLGAFRIGALRVSNERKGGAAIAVLGADHDDAV